MKAPRVFISYGHDSLNLTAYTAIHDSLFNQITQAKQQELFGGWFKLLMETSEIINNTNKRAGQSD